MIPIPVHPVLRMFVPRGRRFYLCCERQGLAKAWATIHGIEPADWRWLSPSKVGHVRKGHAEYAVMIGDTPKALLDAVRAVGLKPISGEGFRY